MTILVHEKKIKKKDSLAYLLKFFCLLLKKNFFLVLKVQFFLDNFQLGLLLYTQKMWFRNYEKNILTRLWPIHHSPLTPLNIPEQHKKHTQNIQYEIWCTILFRCLKNCAKNYDMWRSKNILLLLLFIFYLFIILQRLEKPVDDNICLSLKIVQGAPTSLV